jgi:hypothetical protein
MEAFSVIGKTVGHYLRIGNKDGPAANHLGTQCRGDSPMFDWNFRVRLRGAKYAEWAIRLSESHLEFLLWKVGEFSCHADQVLMLLRKYWKEATFSGSLKRTLFALEWFYALVRARGQLDHLFITQGAGVSIFSDEIRQHLLKGTYTEWASDISDNQLHFLLWQVGEFGYRSDVVFDLLERRSEEITAPGAFAKAKASLESIKMIVLFGEKLDVTKGEPGEICSMLLGYSAPDCWPEAIKDALCNAAPELNWRWVIKTNQGYYLECRNAWNRLVLGKVTNDGKIEIRTSVPVDEVPEVVRTALTKQKPGGKLTEFWTVGPDSRTVRYYECRIIDGLSGSLVRISNDVHRNNLVLNWFEKFKRPVSTRKN